MHMNPLDLQQQVQGLDIHRVDHRSIIRAYMQKLGLISLINNMVPTEMDVEPGLIVAGMVQDTFSGRSPLYRLEQFFATQDTELLLGKSVEPEAFADHNIARVMDRIYQVGPSHIFSELSRRAAISYQLDITTGHWDSTSVSVWGDYDVYNDNDTDERLKITHGHSKDHRPDLKQFMIQMLCVEQNIPIIGDCQDGNSSDKTLNNKLLNRISSHLAKYGIDDKAFTYIADSVMVNKENLECFNTPKHAPPLYFMTRLPFSYDQANRVVTEAIAADKWQPIGTLARSKNTEKRPVATYRSYETNVELYEHSYRAIVVHSSAHDKRRQKRIDRELKQANDTLTAKLNDSCKRFFNCHADAQNELQRLRLLPSSFYSIEGDIKEIVRYTRGRPRKDGTKKIRDRRYQIVARIKDIPEAVATKRAEAGCFVLITNCPIDGKDQQTAKQVLQSYKGQDGVEQNYRFLKDPLIVNDLFLKTPERIEVLGMILLICLLLCNLMQRTMRLHLETTGETIEGWDRKQTNRPTSFMMMIKFMGIMVITAAQTRVIKPALTPVQNDYLKALGLSEHIFTEPRPPP